MNPSTTQKPSSSSAESAFHCSVLIDARKLGDGGIGVYLENLIDSFLEFNQTHENAVGLTLLVTPEVFSATTTKQNAVWQTLLRWSDRVQFVKEPSKKYSVQEYALLAFRHWKLVRAHDIFHSPHYTLPYFLARPSIVTIHDAIHVTNPETWYHKLIGRFLIRSAIRRAKHVITVSDSSRKILGEIASSIETPISVIPNALRQGFEVVSKETVNDFIRQNHLEGGYCVFVGTEKPHKGFMELLDAWAELKRFSRNEGSVMPTLVVIGGKFSYFAQRRVEELGLSRYVKFQGEVSVRSLCLYYNGAKAVIVPSREEGFGLVGLEAMACGAPVVSTPVESLREVCGESGWYASNCSGTSICNTLIKVFSEEAERKRKVIIGIERAKMFSREFVARKTLSVYRNALGLELISPSEVEFERGKEPKVVNIEGGAR